jgi:proteasome lid subunit RPN8/RPN11
MTLNPHIKKKIKEHALEESPRECCGIIVNDVKVVRCRNVAHKPMDHFSLSPLDYMKASREGDINAIYHSHLDEEKFSPSDIINSQTHEVNYILYNIKNNSFSEFNPLKKKTFIHSTSFKTGISDCMTLVINYYKENFDIDLSDLNFLRMKEDWSERDPLLIQKIIELNRTNHSDLFEEIDFLETTLRKHDIISLEYIKGKGVCHTAVYVGSGNIFHHPRGKHPIVEKLTESFQRRVKKVYRLKNER